MEMDSPVPQFKGKLGTLSGNVTYIKAKEAIDWFREKYPPEVAGIRSLMVSQDPIIFRAEIWMNGEMVSAGHASEIEGKARDIRKIETAAIARAVGFCGFSKEAVLRLQAEAIASAQSQPRQKTDVEAAKAKLGAGTNRRIGNIPPVPKAETPSNPPIPQNTPPTPVETQDDPLQAQETASEQSSPVTNGGDFGWTDAKEKAFAENLLKFWDIGVDEAGELAERYRAAQPEDYKEAWLECCSELARENVEMLAEELFYTPFEGGGGLIEFKSAYRVEYYEGRTALSLMLGMPDLADKIKPTTPKEPFSLGRKVRLSWATKTRQRGADKGKAYYQALRVQWADEIVMTVTE